MALIICKECGKEISDKAVACPNCGYPMKNPTPYYPDIEVHHSMDEDWYYDTKNGREISYGEYLDAEEKYEKKEQKKLKAYYQSTQALIDFINDPRESEEIKALKFSLVLSSKELLREFNQKEINIMKDFLRRFNENKNGKGRTNKR